MENTDEIKKLAFQYFEGYISKADEKILFEYIKQSSFNYVAFRQWEREWSVSNVCDSWVDQEWKSLRRKLCIREAVIPMFPNISSFKKWRKIAIVAILMIVFGSSLFAFLKIKFSSIPENYFVCEAPYGSKTKVLLSDGTLVWLNAGSVLKYSNKFNVQDRRVELRGEGYFEVAKRNGAIFTVRTKGYDVVVKGTKFDISAYANDPFISTSLMQGKVEIHCRGTELYMSPGESVKLDLKSGKFIRAKIDVDQSNAWMKSSINFDDISMNELARKLSRKYDVNIHLESGKVGAMRLCISLRNEETVNEVMDALKNIIPISVDYKDKDIYITQ